MNVYQMIVYETLRALFGPWISIAFKFHSEGVENIPTEGGAILVCNHRSVLDPLALMYEIDRFIHFLPGSRGVVVPTVKTLYRMSGIVRFSRSGMDRGAKSLEEAVKLLSEGELVGMFPEGIESFIRSDRVSRVTYFRTGFARVALEARVPVVPAAVIPREEVRLPGQDYVLHRDIMVRVGKPIDLAGFHGKRLTKSTMDSLCGKIRRIVIKLYNGEDLDRFMTGEVPFDIYSERV